MTRSPLQELELNGPDRCEAMSTEAARAWCRRLAGSHYENFSVLSRLVPASRRDDFAAVYAFCRWADDLGDEVESPARALELLAWWRRELEQCFAGEPRHPVFVALAPTIEARDLPIEPFDDLIRAFEQDQIVTRYDTWDQLIDYCRLSADPVGRLVLLTLDQPRDEETLAASDAVCTALQLTNHWQDIARDIVQRDRIYIPREMIRIRSFEPRLRESASQGYAADREFLGETRGLVKALVDRTWPIFERGESLLPRLTPEARPVVWLFAAGGQRVLRGIEMWNYETALHRPRLGRLTRVGLVAAALVRRHTGGFRRRASA